MAGKEATAFGNMGNDRCLSRARRGIFFSSHTCCRRIVKQIPEIYMSRVVLTLEWRVGSDGFGLFGDSVITIHVLVCIFSPFCLGCS